MVYLDLEMNHMKKGRGEVISVGAIKVTEGKIINIFNEIVKPSHCEIDTYVTVLTGITNDDIERAECFTAVFKRFMNWAGDEIIFCFGNADKNSLDYSLKIERKRLKYPHECIRLSNFINNIIDLGPFIWRIDSDSYYMSLSEIALKKVNLNVDFRRVHNPVYDSYLLFKIHEYYKKRALKKHDFKNK